ncbi:histidinol-phosphatase HisJ family protein [Thermohalobacter berrensis]|uniref:Histidinol-phosphatase n=1 Tax=Thermohalobacter berrensis TaxID=99594 RepID=A0A419TAA9_9FIRM|nr:histidinol-phosphatase HisJ family protein [Thermohalobacter berrensis]RKD34419.1 hypothetical protein BET03_00885 [Thermohalobacter berrensis]
MYIADYHIHSHFSGDCNTPMEDIVKHAVNLELKEIAFTDHVDFDYPSPDPNFEIDFDDYLEKFNEIKDKYNHKINIILGIEVGLQPHISDKIKKLVNKYPFAFVIGSIHAADRMDLYNGDFFRGKSQKNAYLRYFENVLENIKIHDEFDVLGHIDYIIRYGNYETKKLSYNDYTDIVDTILKSLITKGKGLELNTSGYRYKLDQTHPQFSILKRYKELGGSIITIGSDSHIVEDICSHFKKAYNLLERAGFNKITLFRNRTPIFVDFINI